MLVWLVVIGLQVYLINELSMRDDENLVQFILNLMEIMSFAQECMDMTSWVVEIDYKNM